MRWVGGRYKGCEAGTRQVQEVQGRYEAGTRGVSQAQGRYKGCEAYKLSFLLGDEGTLPPTIYC